MAEISKETRDAILRDMSDEEFAAEQERRSRPKKHRIRVLAYGNIEVSKEETLTRLTVFDKFDNELASFCFWENEARELINAMKSFQ